MLKNNFFKNVEEAYENRDLETLKKLAQPTKRAINNQNNFSSVLMLSCNNLKHLMKIESLEAQCIILNLEDGVSEEDKPFALVLCAVFLAHHKQSSKKLVVRVNPLGEGAEEEIAYLNQFMPDAVRVPKIKTQTEVQTVLRLLNSEIELHLSIETASVWRNLHSLAVEKRVSTFYLGILDLFADMQLSQELIQRDNPTMHYILSHFLISCKVLGVKPVSFVYQDFKNLEEFGMWIALEKKMGYDTKVCISPKQAQMVNQLFKQEDKEIERAKEIVALFEMNRAKGITGFSHKGYGFIDEPIYKGALVLLGK